MPNWSRSTAPCRCFWGWRGDRPAPDLSVDVGPLKPDIDASASRNFVNLVLFLGHVPLQFVQPRTGRPVRRRAPVAARRQRPTRTDLRSVRHGRPLELAEAEEAPDEQTQPVADLRQLV